MRVLHLIPTLASGGAERMLTRIAQNDDNQHIIVIFRLINKDSCFYDLPSKVILVSLEYETQNDFFKAVRRFLNFLDLYNPNVVQTWMYHANLFGGLIAFFKGHRNIIWNIRSAEVSFKEMKRTTIIIATIGALISHFVPRKIITCSKRAILVHKRLLYKKNKFLYIPNGIHDDYFIDSKKITNQIPVIGFVARLDPQKNHYVFLKSLEKIKTPIKLILVGRGVEKLNTKNFKLDHHDIELFRDTKSIFDFYDRFDFLILPSTYGEAFPNVLIEAMSRGVVCIVSDVGDSFSIVSSSGYQIRDPYSSNSISLSIKNALLDFADRPDKYREKSRKSISIVKQRYGLRKVISQYNQAWFH